MKKLLILFLLTLSIYADNAVKGQTYYLYLLKEPLGYNGAIFAKQHTKKEWEKLFENDAKAFKAKLIKQNPNLKTFIKSEKFKKIVPYLKEFAIQYAKDVKNSPACN